MEIDPLDQRNWANLEWIYEENTRDDPDYQPEIVFDPTNPEALCIAKEPLESISGHFNRIQARGSEVSEPQTVLVERGV